MSFDGFDEQEYILSPELLGSLLGGQVWEIDVPNDVQLAAEGGVLLPYAVVHFGTPIRMREGSSILGEETQPHLMAFQVHVSAAAKAELAAASKVIIRRLTGAVPSETGDASAIKLVGGSTFGKRDDSGSLTRLTRVIFFEVVVGLSGEAI
jgi:hypothetical protein